MYVVWMRLNIFEDLYGTDLARKESYKLHKKLKQYIASSHYRAKMI